MSADQGLLVVPAPGSKIKVRAFETVASRLWNAHPKDSRPAVFVDIFKKQLKTLLFRQAFVELINDYISMTVIDCSPVSCD